MATGPWRLAWEPMASKETNLQVARNSAEAAAQDRQRRRMLVALALLIVALIVVLIRDRQLLLSSSQPSEPIATEQPAPVSTVAPTINTPIAPAPTVQEQLPTPPVAVKAKSKKLKGKKAVAPAPPAEVSPATGGPVITATNRTVLPPLEMEVVAGNQHRPVSPSNNSVKVDMESSASAPPPNPAPPVDAGGPSTVPETSPQVTVPAATAERVTHSVRPEYPLLAKQMKVQGAVVLQALIDRAGRIQELHVVTGPAILASAAQEAVKQWRFKPYYQQGQAVETEARITVNFTISTY